MWSGPGRDESERVAGRVRALVGQSSDSSDDVEPAARPAPRWRIDPGRRPAIAIGMAVLVAALLTGWWVLSSGPRTMPVPAAAPTVPGASPLVSSSGGSAPSVGSSVTPSSAPASQVVVDVAGRVRRPGLYRLPSGARVDDALKAAGGALHGVDLSSLNLAAKLIDGQQIAVGRPAAAPPAPAGGATAPAGSGGAAVPGAPVNLNTATLEQLETLPGIGPALGQRILDYRTAHGTFGSVDQLDDVSGIGTVIFARLKPLVSV